MKECVVVCVKERQLVTHIWTGDIWRQTQDSNYGQRFASRVEAQTWLDSTLHVLPDRCTTEILDV